MKYILALLLLISVLLTSCQNNQQKESLYLHLAHTRALENPYMDSLVEQLDFKVYDMLWLGGDMAWRSSREEETMQHLHQFFHFDKRTTLWSLGNHDYTNPELIQHYTKRPTYYHSQENGIDFLVLDTQDSSSSILGEQLKFFNERIAQVQSPYLVVLHHKLIWLYGHPKFESKINSISNGPFGECPYCLNPNNFYQDIYPQLVEVQEKGTQVICIGGDLGDELQHFEYETEDGIYFLASGVDLNSRESKAIVFHHNLNDRILDWEFKKLVDLP
jgi:hypothetical protein